MSTRERWIIYPILFMTLGIALRDKVTYHVGNPATLVEASTITSPRIRCAELQVGKLVCERLQANQSECGQSQCRALMVSGPNNKPVVVAGSDTNTRAGIVETFTAEGLPQVRLSSNGIGGTVTTIERGGRMALFLGDTGQNFGLFAEIPGLGRLIPLSIPWRFEKKPATPKPPESPTSPKKGPAAQSTQNPQPS
jgi:hypothetical protein